jgi:hypothetical protein
MQNPFIRVGLVGYLTDEVIEYVNYLNIDTRISKPLHINDELGKEFLPMFTDYMHRDSSVRTSTKVLFENNNNDLQLVMSSLTDSSSIEELVRSYHNFYLDYIESIKFITEGSCMVVPYPLSSNRNIDFDYYVILEQDVNQTFAEYSNLSSLFDTYKRRMDEVLPFIPQDRSVRITIPYKPYDESDTASRMTIVDQIGSACSKFFEEHYSNLESSEIDSNPQSSNSTF